MDGPVDSYCKFQIIKNATEDEEPASKTNNNIQ